MSESTVDSSERSAEQAAHPINVDRPVLDDEYYAGLIDAQLGVAFRMKTQLRVTLTSADTRVTDEILAKFSPTKITTTHFPGKKTVCVVVFDKDDARHLLEFAAEKCIFKKDLAAAALNYMDDNATIEQVVEVAGREKTEPDDVSVPWVSGFFDVRGTVVKPQSATDEKKRVRGSVKLVLPKSERVLIPALQRVTCGRIKKSSPSRIVFETKDTIRKFLDVVGGHVRIKRADLQTFI